MNIESLQIVTAEVSPRGLKTLIFSEIPNQFLNPICDFIAKGISEEQFMSPRSLEWIREKLKKGEGVIVLNANTTWSGNDESFSNFIINDFVSCAFLDKHDGVMNDKDIIEICGVYTHPSARRRVDQIGPRIEAGTEAFYSAILRARKIFSDMPIVSWVHKNGSKRALEKAVTDLGTLRLIPRGEFAGHEELLDSEHNPYEVILL